MVKQSAFLMREYAGRERAVHAGNISASRALSTEQQRDIANLRGHVQSNWQTIRDLTTGAAPPLVSAVAAAEQSFLGSFKGQTDTVYKAGAAGATYPMTVQQWYDASNPALNPSFGSRMPRSTSPTSTPPRRLRGPGRSSSCRPPHFARRRCRHRLDLDPVAPCHPSLDRHDGCHAASPGGDMSIDVPALRAPMRSARWRDRSRCSATTPSGQTR